MEKRSGICPGEPQFGEQRSSIYNLFKVNWMTVVTAVGLQRRKSSTLVFAWRPNLMRKALKVRFQQMLGRGLGQALLKRKCGEKPVG